MCDPSAAAWTPAGGAEARSQFLDRDTGSCVALDLDYAGHHLANPVTGRRLHSSLSDISFPFTVLRSTNQCEWAPVVESWEGRGDWHANSESKQAALEAQQCTDPTDTGLCFVNARESAYGISFPDAGYMGFSSTTNPCAGNKCDGMADGPCGCDPCEACPETGNTADHRVSAEICTTNRLAPSVMQTQQTYPQLSTHFIGMQETGMYRKKTRKSNALRYPQCDDDRDVIEFARVFRDLPWYVPVPVRRTGMASGLPAHQDVRELVLCQVQQPAHRNSCF